MVALFIVLLFLSINDRLIFTLSAVRRRRLSRNRRKVLDFITDARPQTFKINNYRRFFRDRRTRRRRSARAKPTPSPPCAGSTPRSQFESRAPNGFFFSARPARRRRRPGAVRDPRGHGMVPGTDHPADRPVPGPAGPVGHQLGALPEQADEERRAGADQLQAQVSQGGDSQEDLHVARAVQPGERQGEAGPRGRHRVQPQVVRVPAAVLPQRSVAVHRVRAVGQQRLSVVVVVGGGRDRGGFFGRGRVGRRAVVRPDRAKREYDNNVIADSLASFLASMFSRRKPSDDNGPANASRGSPPPGRDARPAPVLGPTALAARGSPTDGGQTPVARRRCRRTHYCVTRVCSVYT